MLQLLLMLQNAAGASAIPFHATAIQNSDAWECNAGYFRTASATAPTCVRCRRDLPCEPGWYAVECTSSMVSLRLLLKQLLPLSTQASRATLGGASSTFRSARCYPCTRPMAAGTSLTGAPFSTARAVIIFPPQAPFIPRT